ncbi:MAG: hypothetical protein KAJ19_19505 [Gammaproteobacteria bacterium]|nr:hypothetical protein [Gammaproteobacteria bacterium]
MPITRFGGDGGRMLLQDLHIDPLYVSNEVAGASAGSTTSAFNGVSAMTIRLGWEGKGYLTEEMAPYGLFANTSRPMVPVWKLIRPYRLDPGQSLKVRVIHRDRTAANGGYEKTPAVMFHGKRMKDNLPIMLYDAKDTYEETPTNDYGSINNLTEATYNCPADTPILIYSVASYTERSENEAPNAYPSPLIDVIGPNGRSWVQSDIDNNNLLLGVAPAGANNYTTSDWINGYGWLDPPGSLIQLGEKRGWMRHKNETILVEMEMPTGSISDLAAYDTGGDAEGYDLLVVLTLRGCLEVPNG